MAQFLQDSSSQLTVAGLFQLSETMRIGELAVFFRNNHFSTLYKHEDSSLYILVTDQGYQSEEGVAWEKLENELGDTTFVTSSFEPYSEYERKQREEQEEVQRQILLAEEVSWE
jgi:ubiquitin carboxyl-terminal hydrolase MINDY-1/2